MNMMITRSKSLTRMAQRRGHYICIAIVLFLITSSCGSLNNDVDETKEINVFTIGGLGATIVNSDVDVEIDYFKSIRLGTTYQEIVAEIGEPTGFRGSGITHDFYAIEDVFVVMHFALDNQGEYGRLFHMIVYDTEKMLYEIELK